MDRTPPAPQAANPPRPAASRPRLHVWLSLALALATLAPASGCLHLLLATGIYMFEGGNLVPPKTEALENKRVVVLCRPPASNEYRHAGASRQIAKKVSYLLEKNKVPGIDVVPPQQVDQWLDENDSENYVELGKAVKADMVVHIDLAHFELFKGKTVYQGNADVTIDVYDVKNQGKLAYHEELGEVLFPVHSGIAVQDKSQDQFQREFVTVVSDEIAKHFYKHDPHANFALDAMANR
ncbi:hypothetical protein Mal64_39310 [Pseudobythopirellula maris]|uniref:Uncharacterized protein n=1 Tax=Pseudobythopirellula maris TaxID=2527991 RepID=A0A5C5ZGD6_9BACT|nr:hypothetical protein [Pseudobythopirellula maris]TWT86190.1 hypothetical protein Mal64_39310 [Pseudobythopirellula maris]